MAEFDQPSDPELECGEHAKLEQWDPDDFGLIEDFFNPINSLCPTQASGSVDNYADWQGHAQSQISTYRPSVHSDLQLHSFGPPNMFSSDDARSILPMNMSLSERVLGESAQTVESSFQPRFSVMSTSRLNQHKDLTQYGNNQSREVRQDSQMSNTIGRNFSLSSTFRSRKRPRPENGDDWPTSDRDKGTEQIPILNDAVRKITLEVETKAINLIRGWLKEYSDKAPPSSCDINALATLTRLSISEVNRLLVQMMLLGNSKKPEPITEAALSCESNGNAINSLQKLFIRQSKLSPLELERVVLSKIRAQQCRPIQYIHILSRNPTKIYQCTLGCGKAFMRKWEWTRHETTNNYPQEFWLCTIQPTSTINGVSTCSYCHVENPSMDHAKKVHKEPKFCHTKQLKDQIFFRKDKFVIHFDKFHPSVDMREQFDRAHFQIQSPFPSNCGFCDKTATFLTLHDRFEHIAQHFEAGKDLTTWMQPDSQAPIDDDDNDDDDSNDQNNSKNQGERNGGTLDSDNSQFYLGSSKYPPNDSGYSSKGSGSSSSNSTGSSFGNRHSTELAPEINIQDLIVQQASKEEHSQSTSTSDKMAGTQNQPSNLTKLLTKFTMGDMLKKASKGLYIEDTIVLEDSQRLAHQPRLPQMRRLFHRLKKVFSVPLIENIKSRNSLSPNSRIDKPIKVLETEKLQVPPPEPNPAPVVEFPLSLILVTREQFSKRMPFVSRLQAPHTAIPICSHEDSAKGLSLGGLSPNRLLLERRSSIVSIRSNTIYSSSTKNSTEGSSLNAQLRRSRIEYEHSYLVPICKQKELITVPNIEQDIRFRDDTISETHIKLAAEKACRVAPKVFATLALIRKGHRICSLLMDGISDKDLPFKRYKNEEGVFVLKSSSGKSYETLECWNEDEIEEFDRVQWWMLAPVLKSKEHHDLDDRVNLPYVDFKSVDDIEKKKEGGYSEVFARRLHPSHHDFWPSPTSLDEERLVAIKRLHSSDEMEFKKEEHILKALGSQEKKHPHLITLLATFKHRQKFHLIFPWANANLRKFWSDRPSPSFDNATILWCLKQMTGIAHALNSIHNFTSTGSLSMAGSNDSNKHNSIRSGPGKKETLYGRHGDIKPENILWFQKIPESDDVMGVLQIADFGIGSFHGRNSRSKIDPHDVQTTPTYEGPECKLHRPVSRAYDIWSLGCVYLEFITWALNGSAKINSFSGEDSYFTITDDGHDAVVRKEVVMLVQHLHGHNKCSHLIHDLLDLIMERVLIPDSKERIPAEELWKELNTMLDKAMQDEVYLLQPTPAKQKSKGHERPSKLAFTDIGVPVKNQAPNGGLNHRDAISSSSIAQFRPSRDRARCGVETPAYPGYLRKSYTTEGYQSLGRVK